MAKKAAIPTTESATAINLVDAQDLGNDALLSGIQGNILKGHGRDNTVHFFVSFMAGHKAEAKAWIQKFAEDKITSCKEQLRQRELYKRNKMPGALFAGFYCSKYFYEYLGISLNGFEDEPFKQGMKARRSELQDSDPSAWESGFGINKDTGKQVQIHAMILLAHDDLIELGKAAKEICDDFDPSEEEMAKHKKVKFAKVLNIEYGSAIRNANSDGLEHFGYVDGVSQPLFLKDEVEEYWKKQMRNSNDSPTQRFHPDAHTGLVLCKDPYGNGEEAYGSYFVFRKLEQHVREFKKAEKALAKELKFKTDEEAERVGAMIVGRYEDGTPLTLSEHDKMIGSGVMNNFNYAELIGGKKGDDGSRCPYHGHIRKTNPRTPEDRDYRIARRGIPYGYRNVSTTIEHHFEQMPADGVGLLFMCFQKDIANQFESIQKAANSDTFPNGQKTGIDLIIGQGPASREGYYAKEWNNETEKCPQPFGSFVTLKGGEYFFAPSMPFLKTLAEDMPAEKSIESKKKLDHKSVKALITILFICFVSMALKAQVEKREIKWQDLMRSMEQSVVGKPVQTGRFTVFQISDINKFFYQVEIRGTVFELQTPVPTELQTLFRLTPEQLQQTVTNEKAAEAAELLPEAIAPMQEIKAVKEKELTTKKKALEAVAPANTAVKDTLQQQIDDLEAVVQVFEELVKACEAYKKLIEKVAGNVLALRSARSELISISQMDKPESDIRSMVIAIPALSPAVKTDYALLKSKYHEAEDLYIKAEAFETSDALLDRQIKAVKASLEKVEKADELIDEEGLIGIYTDVMFLYNELLNPNNFKAVAPPVQMDGDLVQYIVNVRPSVTKTLGAYKSPTEFRFDVPAKGGLKVDFSVGPVISFGNNAKDHLFYAQPSAKADSVILMQRENNNAISPGVAAMMHFYPRTGLYHGWGGLFGIGAGFQSVEDVDLSIYAGLSYVVGKKQKIMFNTGLSYLRVDRLKEKEFELNKEYASAAMSIDMVTEKVFKPSFFLSISYNISNRLEVK